MQKYINSVADKNGKPVNGASVLVLNYPAGTTATIYADNNYTALSNPVSTDTNGGFSFYAKDGRYSLQITGQGLATQTIPDILLEDPVDGGSPGSFTTLTVATSGTIAGSAIQTLSTLAASGSAANIGSTAGNVQSDLNARPTNASLAAPGTAANIGTAAGMVQTDIDARPTSASLAASGGAALVGTIAAGTGAVARTQEDKNRDTVSVLDFMTAAQVADVRSFTGSLDVSAAVQAAINAYRATSGSAPSGGVRLKMPAGKYQFNSQVNAYSGVVLEGEGGGTIIVNGAGLISGALIAPASFDGSGTYQFAGVKNLCLQPSGSVWGITGTAADVLDSVFEDITLNGPYGIDLSTNSYTQACTIQRILSVGSAEQILKLTGNFNYVHQIDKEGGTGATTLPYVHTYCAAGAGTNNGNLLSKVLVEGVGSANKVALRIENSDFTTLLDFWKETTVANGNTVEIVGSKVLFKGMMFTAGVSSGVFNVSSASYVHLDFFNAASDDVDWSNYFSVDSTSTLVIDTLYVRRGANQIGATAGTNIQFGQILNQTQQATPTAGFASVQKLDRRGGANLLMNPSFEAGDYGWSFSATPSLEEYIASEVAQGNMMHVQTSGTGFQVTQSINIPVALVGVPVTLRYIAKTNGGVVVPIVDGASSTNINRVSAGAGFQHVIATFNLQTSGVQNFGVWWVGAAAGNDLWIDEFTLSFGTEANINPAKFASFEINGSTWTTGTAAPTTGTWKKGDRVVNSAPAVGSPKAWVCTVAGSPGTFVSEGNL